MANRNTRQRAKLARKASKAGNHPEKGAVLFGTNVDSSALRKASGKKPWAAGSQARRK